jgi:flagellar motility protein MotE (MotC chaperone)
MMSKTERKTLERIAAAHERLVEIIEKQQPSKAAQWLTMVGTIAGILGALSIGEIIRGLIFRRFAW